MQYLQNGGEAAGIQQTMEQIARVFQQLPPQAQKQLLQVLVQIAQNSSEQQPPQQEEQQPPQQSEQIPGGQEVMRMGGFRPTRNQQSEMYR